MSAHHDCSLCVWYIGKAYYYHAITRKTQWERPTDKDAEGTIIMDLGTPEPDSDKEQDEVSFTPGEPVHVGYMYVRSPGYVHVHVHVLNAKTVLVHAVTVLLCLKLSVLLCHCQVDFTVLVHAVTVLLCLKLSVLLCHCQVDFKRGPRTPIDCRHPHTPDETPPLSPTGPRTPSSPTPHSSISPTTTSTTPYFLTNPKSHSPTAHPSEYIKERSFISEDEPTGTLESDSKTTDYMSNSVVKENSPTYSEQYSMTPSPLARSSSPQDHSTSKKRSSRKKRRSVLKESFRHKVSLDAFDNYTTMYFCRFQS